MTYTKDDVERSYHQGSSGRPMVNVKVYGTLADGFRQFTKDEGDVDPGFTEDWVRDKFSDEYLDACFWNACEWEWEYAQGYAEEIFGKGVKLYAEGRSGGWMVVDGLDDVDDWDAVQLAKWRKFEKYAREAAAYIPCGMVSSLYLNEWEAEKAERLEDEPTLDAPEALKREGKSQLVNPTAEPAIVGNI